MSLAQLGVEPAQHVTRWDFAGPVAQAYELAQGPVEKIVGPTGGGKSTASARRCLRVATWQHPSPRDGVRKARIVCITPTYRRAWDQVIPSYKKVMDRFGGRFQGAKGDPYDHIFDADLPIRGHLRRVHVEVLFRAVGDLDLEEFFRGFEFTAGWLPEADTHSDENILSKGSNRAGRYPEPEDRPTLMPADRAAYAVWDGKQPPGIGVVEGLLGHRDLLKATLSQAPNDATLHDQVRSAQAAVDAAMPAGWMEATTAYKGMFGDANAPIIDSWFHQRFWHQKRPGDRLHLQPSGFSARAENMQNLRKIDANYYPNQALKLDAHDRGRLLENKPGYGRHGQPVHGDFDAEIHVVSHSLQVDPQQPVIIGVDCGSNALIPAAAFLQRSYGGQWRALAEIHLPEPSKEEKQRGVTGQMRTDELGAEIRRIVSTRFRAAKGAVMILDPAAGSGSANSAYSTAQHLQQAAGIEAVLAPTNAIKPRRDALAKVLKRPVTAREPGFVISGPDCPGLTTSLTGGWHYAVRGGKQAPAPEKNRYSHIGEACEYAILGGDGVDGAVGGFIRHDGEAEDSAPQVIIE